MKYTVKWVIEVKAPNHRDAAVEARRIMRDCGDLQHVFHVKPAGKTGSPKVIEL